MFSVVIPLYNKREFIVRTVESVLRQSYVDFELIIVDDGSTDGSLEQLAPIQDARLRLIRQTNSGKGAARTRGMSEGRGDWVAFLDADDYWFPNHLAELKRMLARYPDAGLLSTSFLEGEDPSAEAPTATGGIRRIEYFTEAARNMKIVWSSATAIRRSLALELGGFGPWRTGEDLEYWARAALRAPVIKSDRVTAYYLRHSESEMAQVYRQEALRSETRSLLELWPSVAYLEQAKHGLGRELRRAVENYQRQAAYSTLRTRVVAEDFAGARRIAAEMPGWRFDRAQAGALLLRLPIVFLRFGLGARTMLRR